MSKDPSQKGSTPNTTSGGKSSGESGKTNGDGHPTGGDSSGKNERRPVQEVEISIVNFIKNAQPQLSLSERGHYAQAWSKENLPVSGFPSVLKDLWNDFLESASAKELPNKKPRKEPLVAHVLEESTDEESVIRYTKAALGSHKPRIADTLPTTFLKMVALDPLAVEITPVSQTISYARKKAREPELSMLDQHLCLIHDRKVLAISADACRWFLSPPATLAAVWESNEQREFRNICMSMATEGGYSGLYAQRNYEFAVKAIIVADGFNSLAEKGGEMSTKCRYLMDTAKELLGTSDRGTVLSTASASSYEEYKAADRTRTEPTRNDAGNVVINPNQVLSLLSTFFPGFSSMRQGFNSGNRDHSYHNGRGRNPPSATAVLPTPPLQLMGPLSTQPNFHGQPRNFTGCFTCGGNHKQIHCRVFRRF